jgi:hypothetical protein
VRRLIVTVVATVFVGALAVVTILDFVNHGVTGLGVVSLGVVAVIGIGILGALFQRPPPPPE